MRVACFSHIFEFISGRVMRLVERDVRNGSEKPRSAKNGAAAELAKITIGKYRLQTVELMYFYPPRLPPPQRKFNISQYLCPILAEQVLTILLLHATSRHRNAPKMPDAVDF